MTAPEQVVRELLLADPAVSGAVGTRVYPLMVPERAPLPAITYQRISTVPIRDLHGVAYVETRIRVTAWAERYGTARTLGEAVAAALTRGPVTAGVRLIDLIAIAAADELGPTAGIAGAAVDVRVVHDTEEV